MDDLDVGSLENIDEDTGSSKISSMKHFPYLFADRFADVAKASYAYRSAPFEGLMWEPIDTQRLCLRRI